MKTAKEYAAQFREIAAGLGLQGDSVEMLVQMLAHFTYSNEIESIAMANEASLERALLPNSKIQHCDEIMYSVHRGCCPRIILRFRPTRFFEFGLFDPVITSNNFTLYYLGYQGGSWEAATGSYECSLFTEDSGLKFTYAPVVIQPSDEGFVTICCLLARERVQKIDRRLTIDNNYYIDIIDSGLSQDLWVKVGSSQDTQSYIDTCRVFEEHLLGSKVFNLTLPDWGARLYLPESWRIPNTWVTVNAYKYCTLEGINPGDLKSLTLNGAEFVDSSDTDPILSKLETFGPGIYALPETPRENLGTIHYNANQDRYMSSIIRSNTDVSDLLKEMYPDKIADTTYQFSITPDVEIQESRYEVPLASSDYILTSNTVSYQGSNDKYLDFTVNPETIDSIVIGIKSTNETVPVAVTYGIKTDSPVSQDSKDTRVYVVKTFLGADGKEATEVIDDYNAEGIQVQYMYSSEPVGTWKITNTGIIPSRPMVAVSSDTDTETTSKSSETTTEKVTGPDGEVTTKVVETTSDRADTVESSKSNTETMVPSTTAPLWIRLWNSANKVLDQECLPYVTTDTTVFTLTDSEYKIPVTNSLQLIRDYTKNPILIPSLMFVKGSTVTAEKYEIISASSGLLVDIDQEGVLKFSGLTVEEPIGTWNAVIRATYDEIGYTYVFKVTSTATEKSKPRILQLFWKTPTSYIGLMDIKVWAGDTVNIKDPIGILPGIIPNTEFQTFALGVAPGDNSSTEKSYQMIGDRIVKDLYLMEPGTSLMDRAAVLKTSTDNLKVAAQIETTGSTIVVGKSQSIQGASSNDASELLKNVREVTSATETIKNQTPHEVQITGITLINKIRVPVDSELAGPKIKMFYVPRISTNLLGDYEKEEFVKNRKSYYITDNIEIQKGNLVNVVLDLKVVLYQSESAENGKTVNTEVTEITDKYKDKFGIPVGAELREELWAYIGKIANVSRIKTLTLTYRTEKGQVLGESDINQLDSETSYFEFSNYITTEIL